MIVKCMGNHRKDLPTDALIPQDGFQIDKDFGLQIDQYYVVYGMTLYSGYIWYYICETPNDTYPTWKPSPLFEVIDPRLSGYWIYSFRRDEAKNKSYTDLNYPEWMENENDYSNLEKGEEKEVRIFKAYKHAMDLEFPDPRVIDKATILDHRRLMCPLCIDAWESISEDGMVICSLCESLLHNPRYKDKLERLSFD